MNDVMQQTHMTSQEQPKTAGRNHILSITLDTKGRFLFFQLRFQHQSKCLKPRRQIRKSRANFVMQ